MAAILSEGEFAPVKIGIYFADNGVFLSGELDKYPLCSSASLEQD
jgi:hypothetical protein